MIVNVLIGTAEECIIRITDDPYVSPRHARITGSTGGRFYLQDEGSTNGTSIRRLGTAGRIRVYGPTELFPGDEIWLGVRTYLPWAGNY